MPFHGGKQMNRTVESGKTLLVDGPASVAVVSGKVEVFGFLLKNEHKIVIREGKRLPFAVKETTKFDISLGETANVEEIEGDTIPLSWVKAFEELSNLQTKKNVTAIVLGKVDSGKTSFCTYLINRLLLKKHKTAILDGDLGQSDVGPPCTIAYAFAEKPIMDLFSLEAKNAFFVGVTSPSKAIDKVMEGLVLLKKEILSENPDFLIINTDGWVEEEAVNYKVQLVEKLNPEIVFCIQHENELTPLIKSLKKFKCVTVDSPSAIKPRGREKRKGLRELAYIKYLRNSKVQSIPLNWLKIEGNELIGLSTIYENFRQANKIYEFLEMKPLHFTESMDKIYIVIGKKHWINLDNIKKIEEFTKKKVVIIRKGDEQGLLTALFDAQKKFLGIGVLREIDYRRKAMKIYTPISKNISIISLGKVKLDENFREIPVFQMKNN